MARRVLLLSFGLLIAFTLTCCSGHRTIFSSPITPGTTQADGAAPAPLSAWPAALPVDAVQPWEQLDGDGHVLPSESAGAARGASGINADSEFVPGVERYIDSGTGVTDNGEACTITSGASGGEERGWATYRLILGGVQPGVISADVNLLAGRGYFLGLADYGRDSWQWFGPFSDSHVRVSSVLAASADSSYVSPLGNAFISVVVFDGDSVDVVGIGANTVDSADSTAPATPATPSYTAVDGSLLIEWLPVNAGDLAGYRIYYSNHWFDDRLANGVKVANSLEGLTNHLLSAKDTTYIRLSSVDISGNESALGDMLIGFPEEFSDAGPTPTAHFTVSAPSGGLNDAITVSASGGDTFDFDVDGDGLYDITASSSSTATVDTSSVGIIRPHVRAYTGGVMTAQGGG